MAKTSHDTSVTGQPLPSTNLIPRGTEIQVVSQSSCQCCFFWPLIFTSPPFPTHAYTQSLLGCHPRLHPAHSTGTQNKEQPFPSSFQETLHDMVSHALKKNLRSLHTLSIIYTVVMKEGPQSHKDRKTPPIICRVKGNTAHTTNILFSQFLVFLLSYGLKDTQFTFQVPTDNSVWFVHCMLWACTCTVPGNSILKACHPHTKPMARMLGFF